MLHEGEADHDRNCTTALGVCSSNGGPPRDGVAATRHPRLQQPRAACGILNADPPAMSTSQLLQHLYSLDTSSPDLSRLIYRLIQRDEEEQYLSSLEGLELARVVDFLDEVRTLLSSLYLVTK